MAIESIAKTLGTGSGIDIGSLVENLVAAQFENKNALLTQKGETLTKQISTVGEIKSAIADFSTALATLTNGGSLQTAPTSSKPDVLTVTKLPGKDVTGLNTQVEVRQLAQGQVASTNAIAGGASTVIGTGTLTLTFGTATISGTGAMTSFTAGAAAPIAITIDSSHNTLEGVASAINDAKAGVTASVITDSAGARLVVKSNTGATQAFELKGNSGPLRALDIGRNESGSTINTAAQDAIVAVDGVAVKYPTNSITTLVDGVRLDLNAASVGTKVTIGTTAPTAAMKQSLNDFIDTYNQVYKMVKAAVDPTTGPLRGDGATKNLLRQLKGISLAVLNPDAPANGIRTLADVGVSTQRDGTLAINSARLTTVLTSYPGSLEKMFAQGAGLTQALSKISEEAVSTKFGLGASEATYTKRASVVVEDKEDLAVASDKMKKRMTQQFAAMDSRVAAYKATQSFMDQQIKAWNSSN